MWHKKKNYLRFPINIVILNFKYFYYLMEPLLRNQKSNLHSVLFHSLLLGFSATMKENTFYSQFLTWSSVNNVREYVGYGTMISFHSFPSANLSIMSNWYSSSQQVSTFMVFNIYFKHF
ncbi:hypothetical protein ERO13_D06G124150v2 [Gossypium hirsutum]|nr:hypothetical protein ERO13_D06G124150v2 [Gossypium hirsutum]